MVWPIDVKYVIEFIECVSPAVAFNVPFWGCSEGVVSCDFLINGRTMYIECDTEIICYVCSRTEVGAINGWPDIAGEFLLLVFNQHNDRKSWNKGQSIHLKHSAYW